MLENKVLGKKFKSFVIGECYIYSHPQRYKIAWFVSQWRVNESLYRQTIAITSKLLCSTVKLS